MSIISEHEIMFNYAFLILITLSTKINNAPKDFSQLKKMLNLKYIFFSFNFA